jgi:transposase
VCSVIVRYTLGQRVFLYTDLLKSVGENLDVNFVTVHNLANKLRSTGLLIDKKQKHKGRMLTEEKLDDVGARLEHTPRKSLTRLAQETGVSRSSARTATKLLKLRPYKTAIIHALQPRDAGSRYHFCS